MLQCRMRMLIMILLSAMLIITAAAHATTGQDVADFASSDEFQGIRYSYTGESLSGFDCSGFTRYVYSTFGVELPHKAVKQKNEGTEVERDDLMPGDLVFFRNWHHVGIYLGDGNFVHASSGKEQVTISTLVTGYYYDHYSGACRIF